MAVGLERSVLVRPSRTMSNIREERKVRVAHEANVDWVLAGHRCSDPVGHHLWLLHSCGAVLADVGQDPGLQVLEQRLRVRLVLLLRAGTGDEALIDLFLRLLLNDNLDRLLKHIVFQTKRAAQQNAPLAILLSGPFCYRKQ